MDEQMLVGRMNDWMSKRIDVLYRWMDGWLTSAQLTLGLAFIRQMDGQINEVRKGRKEGREEEYVYK